MKKQDKKKLFKEFLEKNQVLIADKNAASRRRLMKTICDLGGKRNQVHCVYHYNEAVELIMHYVSKEIQSEDAANGVYIPVVKGADTSIKNPFLKQVAGNIANSKYHQIFYDQFLGADIGRVVNDVSTDLAAGIISPEEATAQVQESWEFNQ